ncbi:hypothetical protein Chor_009351 [Crotalus horridus]
MLSISVLQRNRYFLLPFYLLFCAVLVPRIVASPVPNSNPLYQFDGQVRLRHLYTANEQIHLHLEIFSDGTVRGSKYQNPFSEYLGNKLLGIPPHEFFWSYMWNWGTVTWVLWGRIRLNPSDLFSLQLLYLEEACNFHEMVLRDGYNVYYSEAYNLPISLSMMENLAHSRQLPPFSQFLPLVNKVPLEPMLMDYEYVQQVPDIESPDPFNIMGQNQGLRSPSFAFR